MISLAQRVRDYRYSKGWGPDELANRASISRTALYQIESGKTELPRAGTLRRIALALDVSMETLLGHPEGAGQGLDAGGSYAGPHGGRGPSQGDWYPSEGAPLAVNGRAARYDLTEGHRFAVEYGPNGQAGIDTAGLLRERELALKLHEILATPYGEPLARIVDETHRLLHPGRLAPTFE